VISYQNCMRCHILIYHEFTCCPCIERMKIVLHENPLASRADTFYVWNYRTLQTQLPSLDLMTQASTSDLSDTDRKIASMSRSFPAPAINPTYGTRPMQFSKDAQYPSSYLFTPLKRSSWNATTGIRRYLPGSAPSGLITSPVQEVMAAITLDSHSIHLGSSGGSNQRE
jgi:hypothetical protein